MSASSHTHRPDGTVHISGCAWIVIGFMTVTAIALISMFVKYRSDRIYEQQTYKIIYDALEQYRMSYVAFADSVEGFSSATVDATKVDESLDSLLEATHALKPLPISSPSLKSKVERLIEETQKDVPPIRECVHSREQRNCSNAAVIARTMRDDY